ncbi:Gfo/Idh/MocA family protein [Niabella drilacis]|uniref:Predicted dehydrogenase n=1 Tax=Niabella drilacis (strain DSM 25811 / CCM 8410 / CCUG 62505 / LMG 26954 / E90) TaxID=1285928 RepID=A0A1G6WB95_NIADE|nr:Gfo/Idh/MocA family oxidoreductase [Niabella drilacis]SDD62507.1 Predicted dehydrogenase [Niabella drilacis]
MYTRKKFIRNVFMGAVAASALPKSSPGASVPTAVAPKDRVRLAVIGKGNMGSSDLQTALSTGMATLAGVCDIFDKNLDALRQQEGKGVLFTKDYREILDRKDIDAVIIGTPDHWHQKIAIEAMKAGKDVYCEKPVIHSLQEGRALVEAQEKTGRIFQMGSQGMSSWGNQLAKKMVEEGFIGAVSQVDGQFTAAPSSLKPFVAPPEANEKTIWWNRFLGSAPKHAFDAQRFLQWRSWSDYGTGVAGDLFVHVIASTHFIMNAAGPEKAYSTGGIRYYTNNSRDTPDLLLGYLDYPDQDKKGAFTLSLSANLADGVSKKWGSTDFTIKGAGGSLTVGWDKVVLKTNGKTDTGLFGRLKELLTSAPVKVSDNEYEFNVGAGNRGAHHDHFVNFLSAIRNGGKTIADTRFGVQASAASLLCYESYLKQKALAWDPRLWKLRS